MTCRLPAAVHVPLNSYHSDSLGAGPGCACDAAPAPAIISTRRRRVDLRRPSFLGGRVVARGLRSLSGCPHKSAAKGVTDRPPCPISPILCRRFGDAIPTMSLCLGPVFKKQARIEQVRPVEVREGALGVALGLVRKGAVVESKRMFRVDPDRLAEVRDRAVGVALRAILEAAVVEGIGVLRIVPYRFVVVRDGTVGIPLAPYARARLWNASACFGSSRIASL